jgi:hypothetical protein
MGSVVKSAVGALGGAGPAAMIGGQVIGGLLASRGAKSQAAAMNQQAAAQMEAARIAAEEARFRPVGITTRFGSATPQFTGGRLSGYEYQASPELSALQDQLSRIYGSSLGQAEQAAAFQPQFEQAAQGLFALGQAELPQSREQIMAEQQALLRPYDIEEEQRLAAGVFGRGRGGLSVGTGGQPELQALAEARRRRDLQLSANVNQEFMNRAQQAAGLFGTGAGLLGQGYQTQQAALAPFQSTFQTQQALEEEARRPMDIGSALGAKTSTAGATAGKMMMGGQQAAGALQQQAASAKAAQLAGMGQGIAGLGQQYYQQQQYNDWLNRAYPRTPAPIESRTVGGTTIQQNTIPIWGG